MLHEALPRATSLGGGGCSKHEGVMDQGKDLLDRDKSADKGSDSTDEMSHILDGILIDIGDEDPITTPLEDLVTLVVGVTTLAVVKIVGVGKLPLAVVTAGETPVLAVAIDRLAVVKTDLKPLLARIFAAPKVPKISRIHAEKELEMMIAELDRSNEMVAKYLSEYEQAEAGFSHDEKVELITELLMYQRHLAQIKKYQAQQNKPASKTKRRNFYMSILRSNAGWKARDFKGMTFELKRPGIQLDKESFKKLKTAKASGTEPTQEQQFEEPKELSKEELKKMMELVPVEELYIESLQSLVKETCSTIEVTDEKAKELLVELKRLYETDSRDPMGHQIFMLVEKDYPLTKGLTSLMLSNMLQVDQIQKCISVPTADVYTAKKFATVEDFALLHEDKIHLESKTHAEYIIAFDASKEAAWIRKFIFGLGVVPIIEEPINMYCDNTGSIAIVKDHGVTKDVAIYQYICIPLLCLPSGSYWKMVVGSNGSPSAGVTTVVVTSGSAFVSASKASLFTAFNAVSSSSIVGLTSGLVSVSKMPAFSVTSSTAVSNAAGSMSSFACLAIVSVTSTGSTISSGAWSDIRIDLTCMEDTHICISDLARSLTSKLIGDDSVPFYGVFDEHGGEVESQFVRDNLPRIIANDATFSLKLKQVVTRLFMETDDAFARSCALKSDISSGTIALSAMIFG
nr:probable protein phosphatase 2C 27 [Tanacetum cinerariifolium]